MAENEETETEQTDAQAAEQTDPQEADKPATDWKAEARKWEKRAHDNKSAAEELARLKDAEKTEQQRLQERAEKAESELAAMKTERERNALAAKVAESKGVKASLLHGDTEEDMEAEADAILAFVAERVPGVPADKGGAATPAPMSKEQILKMKDGPEKIRAIAQNRGLFE